LYGQLKALAVRITVIYINSPRLHNTKRATPVDLGGIMELPRQKWEEHIIGELNEQDPELNITLEFA
jgi:hypothetical protein